MASWTSFLPQAERWVSGLGLHPLYGHPGRKKKAKKIRLHKAHVHNHMISAGVHPHASPIKLSSKRPKGWIK